MAAPNNLIVAWPSTAASIPAGWARYATLDSKVPKPAAAGIGTTGGLDTHTHPADSHTHSDTHNHAHGGYNNTVLNFGPVNSGASSGGMTAGTSHAASIPVNNATGLTTGPNSGTSTSGTSIGFARVSVIWIQSNGTTDIPANALAWSAYNPRPANWNAYANGVNAYLRGAAVGADGGTLTASASHNHMFAHAHAHSAGAHTHTAIGGTSGLATHTAGLSVDPTGSLDVDAAESHTHNSAGSTASATHNTSNGGSDNATSDSQTPDPAFHKLEVVQAASQAATPAGIVALWPNVTPPALWGSCDGTNLTPNLNGTGRYVKGANGVGEIGTTGGSNTHTQTGSHSHTVNAAGTHSNSGSSSGPSNGTYNIGREDAFDATRYYGHTHQTNATGVRAGNSSTDNQNYASANHEPAYVQMFFIMLLPVNKTITGAIGTATALGKAGVVTAIPSVLIGGAIATAIAEGIAGHLRQPLSAEITAGSIDDALGGCNGPVVIRHRFEYWRDFVFVEDVSRAIESAEIQLDNGRAVTRTARFTIRPDLLPVGVTFSNEHEHLASYAELLVSGTWVRFPLGVFHVDSATEHILPNHQEFWEAQAMDIAGHLWEHELQVPYTVPAGMNYVEAAEAICHSIGLPTNISPTGFTTPVAFSWPPGKPFGEVVNDLLFGINYYPLWASSDGFITSRERLDPYLEPPVVTYTTEFVPRLIRSPFDRLRSSSRFANCAIVTISTPSRAPSSVQVTNDDADSIVSTVNKAATTVQKLAGDRTANASLMSAVGASLVRDAAAKAQAATFNTHPDPRRDAHEFYTITIDNREEGTKWQSDGWVYECKTGATMTHHIGRAERVDVTVEVLV